MAQAHPVIQSRQRVSMPPLLPLVIPSHIPQPIHPLQPLPQHSEIPIGTTGVTQLHARAQAHPVTHGHQSHQRASHHPPPPLIDVPLA